MISSQSSRPVSGATAPPQKFCIVGAGSSGLAAAKNLQQLGIPFDCLEREDDVGGNWYYGSRASRVYDSTHLISSKRLTEFTDFPMPEAYPEFVHHRQAWEYLRNYARHFGLYERIEFNTEIKQVRRAETVWEVALADGTRRNYRGLLVANGHNWDPKWPDFEGEFDGQLLHSADYKTPEVLAGKRVLVVGAGNSGCDIAVESARNAAATFHSARRGYHYLPKFLLGKPVDQCGERLLAWRLPIWLRRGIAAWLTRVALGRPEMYGLPRPDHRLFETHPIINSQMLYEVGHGRITPKPDVARLEGKQVRFADGSVEPIDVIVCATGYRISVPFLDERELKWRDGRPELFLNVFHPERDDLFVLGLIQPDSGQWGLVDYQAQLVARYIRALDRANCGSGVAHGEGTNGGKQSASRSRADWFRRLKQTERPDLGRGIRYVESTRHLLEVEHFSYRRRLQKLIKKME